jgi:transcriptional regulator with XRE-family HTH domain
MSEQTNIELKEKRMNTEHENMKPTGRIYGSVDDLMKNEGVSQDVKTKVAEYKGETRIILQLARLRQKAGLTQEHMAERLGVNQSAISKLESGKDEDLTMRQVREYARATGERINITFGKPPTNVEAVKLHAMGIRDRLEALAKIANQEEEMEKEIQGFFGEAFFNILSILSNCNDQLPHSVAVFEMNIEVIKTDSRSPHYRPANRTDPVAA